MQNSHQRIGHKRLNPMVIELNFEKKKRNSEKVDSETSKLQPVNLSETSRDTAGVHQRVADFLMFLPFVTAQTLKCNERLINGLFHSRCLGVHASYLEASII